MPQQRGRNAGVTGIVDIIGAPKFTSRIYKFSRQTSAGALTRTKRGDAWKRIRQTTPGGTLALSGKVQQAGFPLPDNIKGASGSIVLQFNGAAKETLAVTVISATLTLSETAEDVWDIALACEVTANPTLAGFSGTQGSSAPNPSYEAVELVAGISKSVDPDGLADADNRPYDLDGLTDTDAAETTAIANIIGAAAATRSGMKLRNALFQRTDHWGGTVNVTFQRTTTAEDIINQSSSVSIDPNNLQSQATAAAINGSPSTPSGASFLLRNTRTNELNDNNILHVAEYGLNTTKDDVEMGGTDKTADPFELEAAGHITQVTTSATPPSTPSAPTAGAVYVDTLTRQLVNGEYSHTFLYGPRTTADEVILPHTWTLEDPGDLDSEGEIAAIGSVPATPSPYYDRGVTGHYLTSGKILYVKKFGRRSTVQDVEMEHTTSEGTPFEGLTTSTATVISSASAVDVIAAANYSTDPSFAGVSVKRLNDALALLITRIRDDPRIINFEMRSPGEEPVRGYYDGTDVRVYLRRKFQRGNRWVYELALQPLPVVRMRFSIRKRITGSDISSDMAWGLVGNTNNSSFLGLATGFVAYRGIDGEHNYSFGGPAEIANQCEYLAIGVGGSPMRGHIDFKKCNLGWHSSSTDPGTVGTWVKATDLKEDTTAFDSAALPTADFSGLLS